MRSSIPDEPAEDGSGQAAIAWVNAKGVLAILGPRTRAQLDENLGAAMSKLTDDHSRRLDAVSAVPLGYPACSHDRPPVGPDRIPETGGRLIGRMKMPHHYTWA
jgi:diketogulonate reductase-like aldo/keto reductase